MTKSELIQEIQNIINYTNGMLTASERIREELLNIESLFLRYDESCSLDEALLVEGANRDSIALVRDMLDELLGGVEAWEVE